MLDERLFSLLATLAAVDLDWLGIETEQYLLQGIVGLESQETLTGVRKAISDAVPRDAVGFSFPVDEAADQPFEKSQQIDLAIKFIVTRLRSIVGMTSDSIERLAELSGTPTITAQGRDGGGNIFHVLATPESTHVTSVEDLELARRFIADLERSLQDWRDSLSDGTP